ncbi:hypothetical protein Val02_57360 [Virgisporangium aliadipatigenens]|uniref:DUF1835 domain-containing protein n=1 Tax=Virgisporangium aliadipatigenens TaxID=741659 RepID=A0A8J4DS52_9ACTN|nr:DUF1835 domain-containing protein [Virgisporangium aliadipatigenens]GIJ48850.1 hypothetical protein Val02_57360 [Virgisporangium aliadipatigenens]
MWTPDVAHLRCGDDLRDKLRGGDYFCYADPVCQGPLPATELVAARAQFVAEAYGEPAHEVEARFLAEELALDRLDKYRIVLLWLGADWYDQAVLVRVLARFSEQGPTAVERFRLVPIAAGCFGDLDAPALEAAARQARPIDDDQLVLAVWAWDGMRAPTPEPLQGLLDHGASALPHLAAGVRRHLADLPWTTDGLSLSERLCLRAVAGGAHTLREIFPAVRAADPAPFHGDSQLRPVLRDLCTEEDPALVRDGDGWRATAHGTAILNGDAQWRGDGRWLGGIEVTPRPAWLWDPDQRRISRGLGW